MSKGYVGHWVIGVLCAVIWFWGDKMGIPDAAITLCSSIVPGLLGHALAYSPADAEIINPTVKDSLTVAPPTPPVA